MSPLTILLTGSTGFVGRHLKKRLESLGHTVKTHIRGQDIHVQYPFHTIINCAAELTDESKMFDSNVSLTRDILEHAAGRFNRVIHVGSSSEYGCVNSVRREDSVCVPSNIYEATKLAATALCQGYASRYDLDISIARPFSLYGPNDKPRKLIPSLYRSYIEHKPIDLYPGAHDWLYIDDFIDGLVALLGAPTEVTKGQVFNFGTGVSSSNLAVVAALESALGSKLDVRYQTGARFHAHDVDNWVADATKARSILGWEPKYDLQSGMHAYVMTEWFGNQGDQG